MAAFSNSIGILVSGFNSLSAPLLKAEASLLRFRGVAESVAGSINRRFGEPLDINMTAVNQAEQRFSSLGKKALIAGTVLAGGLGLAVHGAMGFNTAMAEVSTLVDTSTTNMNALTSQVRELSKEYGQMPVDTAKALYTTISAGYGDAADASVLLEGAMKLARGGITDTGTAIDGLTSIMNSYGMAASQVRGVSDQMFVAMKAGKTTIGELSGSLGKVTPLASSAGLSLDQVLSATSALTLGGLNTAEAVTSLRGILSAVIKPTSDATKTAESLGIEFSAAAMKSMGLQKWLAQVAEKSGGSQEVLASLFGRVEALSGVLALTGNQAGSFASILEQMGNSAGATDEAFRKVNESAQAAFDRAKANAAVLLETIGNALLPLVSRLADAFAWLSGKISSFAEAHPFLTKTVVVLAAVTAGVLLIGGAALIMGAQVMAAMTMVNLSTGGVLLAVGALITGITALALWWTSGTEEMGESAGILSRIWNTVRSSFYDMATPIAYGLGYLTAVFTTAWGTISTYTSKVWPLIGRAITTVWQAIRTFAFPTLALFQGILTTAWGVMATMTAFTWKLIRVTVVSTLQGLVSAVSILWNVFSGVFAAGLRLLSGDWEGAWLEILVMGHNVWEDLKSLVGVFLGWLSGLGGAFSDAGAGLIDAFWQGILAAWGTLKDGFVNLLEGVKALLPHSDADEGPLSTLTQSGRALTETLAGGIRQQADEPAKAMSESLSTIQLQPAKWDVVGDLSPVVGQSSQRPATSRPRQSEATRVVFQKGAFQIHVSGEDALNDLEERLAEIFARTALRLGGQP